MQNITRKEYVSLSDAYDFFNARLFDGKLPECLITFQRHAKSRGYFCANRFSGRTTEKKIHEIALNPDHFNGRTDAQIFSTLAHEMVHLAEEENGTAPKNAYHNKSWAEHMKRVGLYPSDTAAVGGKETGPRVSHYIIEGGVFEATCSELLADGIALSWESACGGRDKEKAKAKRESKSKFTCHGCDANAWGKPDLKLVCGECEMPLVCNNS